MKSIFTSSQFENITRVVEYPDGLIAEEGISEQIILSEYKEIKGCVNSTFLNGIHIEQRKIILEEELIIEVQHDFPFLKMQFELEGYSLFSSAVKQVPDVEITGQSHQLFYLPEVKGRLQYKRSRRTLEIKLTLDFLNRIFMHDLKPLLHFGDAITNGSPILLSSKPMPITMEMGLLIQEITNCAYIGQLRRMFLECKVIELLLLQILQFNSPRTKQQTKISKEDADKLAYVKELIEINIENPLTIMQLSYLSGINDFKLKRDFKQFFGITLFGYLTKIRFEKAKQLISIGYHISEVSYMIGYKHQQHFTAAFKKNFGCLPSKIV